ncbi:hypothetical protein CTAYLR_007318 [Chrysophaeum taylorii]|uniref:O-methyltransferase domain-containing protein n=1 Tax=Chrysophaeum taylorii TaxID=2483200 RepID=A0AAD7XIL0_9STRA|nr:hypothetical protein CTAYLR_007318 [Chrysophaeum taylorii]
MRLAPLLVAAVALVAGYLIGTSPASVVPPVMPESSLVKELPPWPVYRFFVGLNDVLRYLAEKTTPPDIRALELSNSFWQSVVVYGLVKHGAFDALAEAGGTSRCSAVALKTGTHPHYLCRFMHAGATLGIFEEPEPGVFRTTAISEELRTRSRDRALWLSAMLRDNYVATAEKSIMTGAPGCVEHLGAPWWEWHADHPYESELFDRAMKDFSLRTAAAVVGALPLKGTEVVCDVGGGIGTLLATIWEHWPSTTVKVFDLPETARRAIEYFELKEVGNNATAIPASFFDPLPADLKTCDIIFLKNVLHDWADDDCVKILSNIKQSAAPGARLAIVEATVGTDGPSFERAKAAVEAGILSTCPQGAKERTLAEFAHLLRRAGVIEGDHQTPTLIKLRELLSLMIVPL